MTPRLPPQQGQGPAAGSAPLQVQGSSAGQAGRPRVNANPNNLADAKAANPLQFTGYGLSQTRGLRNEQRHPTLMPGPKMGAGGNLADARGTPNTNTGMAQGGTGAPGYQINPSATANLPPVFQPTPSREQLPPSYAQPTPPKTYTPGPGGLQIGSTTSGLEGVPPASRGPLIATDSGAHYDTNGDLNISNEEQAVDPEVVRQQGSPTPPPGVYPPGPPPPGYDYVWDGFNWGLHPQSTDQNTGVGQDLQSYLDSVGQVPQMDRSALEASIRAADQQQALESSRQLQAMAEAGARAGVDAGQAAGMQGEIQHQGAVERATRGANMRLQADVQNFQAQVQAYAQRHQAALQAAQHAQNDKEREFAYAVAKDMLARQTAAQKELEQTQWELSKKMSWQDYAGTALAYHQSKSSDAHSAFGSFLGGKGGL